MSRIRAPRHLPRESCLLLHLDNRQFVELFSISFGIDVQDKWDNKVGSRNEKERAPIDDSRETCSGHTRDSNKPGEDSSEDVGPHEAAGAGLDEVVADNNDVDRDRGDERGYRKSVSGNLRENSDIRRGADGLDQGRIVRDVIGHSAEDGHQDIDGCRDTHTPADGLVDGDVRLLVIGSRWHCSDEGVVEEDGPECL